MQASFSGALRPAAPKIIEIPHLGGRGALYLLALVQGHQSRQRVTPTPEATGALLAVLDALGVIRAEPCQTPLSNLTVGDNLPWLYTWDPIAFDELQGCLTAYLTTAGRSKDFSDTWLRVWHELMPAEVIAYLQYQLRIHQFSDAFLEELAKLMVPNESRYSLGHWRYACWASVRSMASVSLQHPGNVELLKFTLATELPRRLQFAHGSQEGKLCFSPPHSIPMSTLSTILSDIATRLGDNFWKSPPTLEML